MEYIFVCGLVCDFGVVIVYGVVLFLDGLVVGIGEFFGGFVVVMEYGIVDVGY